MTKKDDVDFESSAKCWVCGNRYVDGNVKAKNHCHITGKYSCSAHRDYNIKLKLSYKIPIVFHNLKNYGPYLTMQEFGKFDFKINIIPNKLEKYMSVSINHKLVFIDSFQFLSSSLESLVEYLSKNGFKHLSQQSDSRALDLVKQKIFYPYKYLNDFESLKKDFLVKINFIVHWLTKKVSDEDYEHVLKSFE